MDFSLEQLQFENEIIELNSREQNLLSKFKLDKVQSIEEDFKQSIGVEISDNVRDNMLANAELEVKALTAFVKSGGFAREFIYFNNNLNNANKSLCDALNDPSLIRVPWAEMVRDVINLNYRHFMQLVRLHEKELEDLKQHISQVANGLYKALKSVIRIASYHVKVILDNIVEVVENYALPGILVGVSIAGIGFAILQRYVPRVSLAVTAFINPLVAVGVISAIGASSFTAGVILGKQTYEKLTKEEQVVKRLGLRKSRNSVQALMRAIEQKKITNNDRQPYSDMEDKLTVYRNEIEGLIELRD